MFGEGWGRVHKIELDLLKLHTCCSAQHFVGMERYLIACCQWFCDTVVFNFVDLHQVYDVVR